MKLEGYLHIILAIILLPIFASCRRELCYNHFPTMDISLSWEREWERDYGMHHPDRWDAAYHGSSYDDLRPWKPEWVTMVRYADEGMPEERFLGSDGGKFIMSGGKSTSMLLYNGDTEYIVLSDIASLYNARAAATPRSRASIERVLERHPDARTTNPPDVLYSAFLEQVPEVQNHEVKQMPIKMQPLVYTYVITYEFEHGIEHVALARGALGGMAESVYLRTGVTSDESAIILYDCYTDSKGCRSRVRSFGVPGFPDSYYGRSNPDRTFTLNLEVMLKNGKIIEFNFDVSDQMANQPRGGVIKVTGIRIEDNENNNNSGFNVDVTGWGNHKDIDLPVGVG